MYVCLDLYKRVGMSKHPPPWSRVSGAGLGALGRASGGCGALRSRLWLAHGAFRYANDAPKRFPDAPVPHQQLRKRPLSGRVAQKLYKTHCFFTFFVIAFSTKYCPLWDLWRAFCGSQGHLWQFFGSLGHTGLAQDGFSEGQGRPKTAPRRFKGGPKTV